MRTSRALFTALAVALVTVTVSCTSEEPAAGPRGTDNDSSSIASPPAAITITIGTDDSPGVPSAAQIQHLAAEVERRSAGRVRIEPKWHAAGDGHDDWDQAIARMVTSGELDLAVAPTWAWDVLGVTTLQPLQVPLLVDSDRLVADVVTDAGLTTQLLAGLPAAGVHGISLWPEGLRHPFGFDRPLLTPSDYFGQVFRTPLSDVSTRIFEALGATTTAKDPDASTMVGLQSEYAYSPNGIGVPNITWFPKVNVLYANADAWDALDSGTRVLITEAAASTQRWAIEQADDVEAGKAFCLDDGVLVTASAEQIESLQMATQQVADSLTTEHAEVVGELSRRKSTLPAPPTAAPCGSVPAVERTSGAAEAALNGTYRFTITADEIRDAGGTQSNASNNEGVQNYVLRDGSISYRLDPTGRTTEASDVADGTYHVEGDVLTLRFPSYENEVDTLRFEVDPDGNLIMTFVRSTTSSPYLSLLLAGKPWERIG